MKKINPLVAFAMVVGITLSSHTTMTLAGDLSNEQVVEVCTNFSDLTTYIMSERQRGVSQDTVRSVFSNSGSSKLIDRSIKEAWKIPQAQTPEMQEEIISKFAHDNYWACLYSF